MQIKLCFISYKSEIAVAPVKNLEKFENIIVKRGTAGISGVCLSFSK